ncbi:MAG: ABC transporter ATP-binding protein [Acidobacteriota bacterium]
MRTDTDLCVATERLAKTYRTGLLRPPVRALCGVDLGVPRGRVFGLLGPNGAGKTTLVKLLLGIAFPTSGRAWLLGRPAGDVRARARVGYLPENHRYPQHLTGEQVLHYFGRLSGIPEPLRRRRVDDLLRLVRMEEWRRVRVGKYSKGMMQRLGMAQAMLNEPDLLILDEPTDGVDPIGRREIRDLLIAQRERGTTVFLNSHLLSEVERLCDRVAILKEGRLVRQGGIEELTRTSETYRVGVCGLKPEVVPALRAAAPGLRVGDAHLEIAADLDGLNRLIDALRAHGVAIDFVHRDRASLEEVFVRVVREDEA